MTANDALAIALANITQRTPILAADRLKVGMSIFVDGWSTGREVISITDEGDGNGWSIEWQAGRDVTEILSVDDAGFVEVDLSDSYTARLYGQIVDGVEAGSFMQAAE